MNPTHHVDEGVLLDYVTGAASEPVALVVACHVTLCAACRTLLAEAESLGGALLEQAPQVAVADGALARLMARLDESPESPAAATDPDAKASAEKPFMYGGVALPRPLARYLERGSGSKAGRTSPAFRFLAPGVRGIDLPTSASAVVRTRLLRLSAGVEIPRHAHAAPEYTLVFSGGLSDGGQHYARGDVRFCDDAAVHVQRVDPDGPCIALVVNEGALLPQTWRGRLVSLLFDR